MKRRIVVATANAGKMREIQMILADLNCEILSMAEAGAVFPIAEDGTTFAENARIKARAVWESVGGLVLADDSGLAVDYLGGAPGVYSSRYMGEDTSYEIKNQAIIDQLADVGGAQRSARFVCCMVCVLPDGSEISTEKTMEGVIARKPAGCGGFGYDPILYIPELQKTSAELSPEEKNRISHRGKALTAMKEKLAAVLGEGVG